VVATAAAFAAALPHSLVRHTPHIRPLPLPLHYQIPQPVAPKNGAYHTLPQSCSTRLQT
jgi:hypothetical protein